MLKTGKVHGTALKNKSVGELSSVFLTGKFICLGLA